MTAAMVALLFPVEKTPWLRVSVTADASVVTTFPDESSTATLTAP